MEPIRSYVAAPARKPHIRAFLFTKTLHEINEISPTWVHSIHGSFDRLWWWWCIRSRTQPVAMSVEFPTKVVDRSKYPVSILIQPSFLTKCELSNAAGTAIACRPAVVTVSTLAGSGVTGSADGTGTATQFGEPIFVATDAHGNAYVGDVARNKIRKITAAGVVTTIAGTGLLGSTNGPAATASFNSPRGIALDAAGNLYVPDQVNHRVNMMYKNGAVTTIAGLGAAGKLDGPGLSAKFNAPIGIAIDSSGNLLIGEPGNFMVRKISAQ
jgi:hypothetical protein